MNFNVAFVAKVLKQRQSSFYTLNLVYVKDKHQVKFKAKIVIQKNFSVNSNSVMMCEDEKRQLSKMRSFEK